MGITEFLAWLGGTPWSVALHESQYVWPFSESLHVLTLALFAGSAIMLDLRLLGVAFTPLPVTALTSKLLPWTRASFLVMVATGVLLFYATPLTYYHSVFFRIKVLLLVVAGVNVFLFHTRTLHALEERAADARLPRGARVAAIVSLIAWGGVIVSGRLIAYNWFDCDLHQQPPFIQWAASCPAPAP